MPSWTRTLSSSRSWLVIAVCGLSAFGLSLLNRDYALKQAVPVLLLLALIPVAHVSGRIASLLVATITGFIFAAFLFEPYGSLAIRNAADRMELFWFAIFALAIIRFSPPSALQLKPSTVEKPAPAGD